jgi:hypothetical protein
MPVLAHFVVASVVLAVLVGCAQPPPRKVTRSATVSEALRSRLGVVGVTQLDGVPCKADVGPTDRLDGAMEGARVGGALSGAGVPGIAIGTAAALVGSVAGAARVVPEETAREVETRLGRVCHHAGEKRLLQSELVQEAARTHVPNVQAIPTDVAVVRDETPDYRRLADRGIDTVLEIWVLRVDAVGRWGDDPELTLHMQAVARLLDARSNSVLYDGATFEYVSKPRKVSALNADRGRLFEIGVRDAHQAIAASIVDKIYDPISSWGEPRYGSSGSTTGTPRPSASH